MGIGEGMVLSSSNQGGHTYERLKGRELINARSKKNVFDVVIDNGEIRMSSLERFFYRLGLSRLELSRAM